MIRQTAFALSFLLFSFAAASQEVEPDRAVIAVELDGTNSPAGLTTAVREEFVRAARFASRYYDLGDLSSAFQQLQQANAAFPDHPSILHNLAVVLTRLGRYAEAQEQVDAYLRLYPMGSEADRIRSLQIDLDFQRDLQQRAQQTQNYVELFNRASFAFEQRNFQDSLEQFRQAEQRNPTDAAAVYNQAIALEALGDYAGATERLRRYLALENDPNVKAEADRRIFDLEREITDRRTSLVCAFCGWKLAAGQYWCPRCWRGPYLADAPRMNTRPCGSGASATRSNFYADGRVALNEELSCLFDGANYHEALRYSRTKQLAIQNERKKEGWKYDGDVIASYEKRGDTIDLIQGDYLRALRSPSTGAVLHFNAERVDQVWLLREEDLLIEDDIYRKRYTYDDRGRIATESVSYRATGECGHLIHAQATYQYEGDLLVSIAFSGGNDGFNFEGLPKTTWTANLLFRRDDKGRITSEVFDVDKYEKVVTQRPERQIDTVFDRSYPGWRRNRPIDLRSRGDFCGIIGSKLIGNMIDLRPFYSVAPSIATQLSFGVTRIETSYTYPSSFELP